jgi:hypothetical protein
MQIDIQVLLPNIILCHKNICYKESFSINEMNSKKTATKPIYRVRQLLIENLHCYELANEISNFDQRIQTGHY